MNDLGSLEWRVGAVLLLAASLLPGRSHPTPQGGPGLEVRTERADYAPGERVELSFANRDTVPYSVDPCPTGVERHSDRGWEVAQGIGSNRCTATREVVRPGDTLFAYIELPRRLADGRYRARFADARVAERRSVDGASAAPAFHPVTNGFTVTCAHFRCRSR